MRAFIQTCADIHSVCWHVSARVRACPNRVLGVDVRAGLDQHLRHLLVPRIASEDEGRPAVLETGRAGEGQGNRARAYRRLLDLSSIFLCMCVYIFVYNIHMCIICVCVSICIHVYVHVHICICRYTHTYVNTHTCTHTCILFRRGRKSLQAHALGNVYIQPYIHA